MALTFSTSTQTISIVHVCDNLVMQYHEIFRFSFLFLLSSMYIRRKYWIRENFRLTGKKFFTASIFGKNISKYAKLILEPYICDNLNRNYRFFSFLTKKFWNLEASENRLEDIRLISFIHEWLYFTGIKIVCSLLKLNCYNLYVLYVSPLGGGKWHNIFS